MKAVCSWNNVDEIPQRWWQTKDRANLRRIEETARVSANLCRSPFATTTNRYNNAAATAIPRASVAAPIGIQIARVHAWHETVRHRTATSPAWSPVPCDLVTRYAPEPGASPKYVAAPYRLPLRQRPWRQPTRRPEKMQNPAQSVRAGQFPAPPLAPGKMLPE